MELKATLFSKQREVKSRGKKNVSGNDGTALTTNTVSEKVSLKRPRSIAKKQPLTSPYAHVTTDGGDMAQAAEAEAGRERREC